MHACILTIHACMYINYTCMHANRTNVSEGTEIYLFIARAKQRVWTARTTSDKLATVCLTYQCIAAIGSHQKSKLLARLATTATMLVLHGSWYPGKQRCSMFMTCKVTTPAEFALESDTEHHCCRHRTK